MSLLEEYKQSLKSIEVEELIDVFLYRAIGFVFVKSIIKTNITPNQITVVALILGIISGIFYALGAEYLAWAASFYLGYYLLDCSDGQLARLKKNGTRLGRVIDGIADYLTHLTVYLGLGIATAQASGEPLTAWLTVLAALTSMVFHAIVMDYYRNRYLEYQYGEVSLYGSDLQEFTEEYEQLKKQKGKHLTKAFYVLYLKYLSIQQLFVSEKTNSNSKKFDTVDFLKRNKFLMRLWTFMGTGTHISLLIVTSYFNRIDIYLWGIILVINFYAIIMVLSQLFVDKMTKKL